ncbi:TPA: hypothetical protein HA259_02480 [Thermoplasmata archaeon]|nr:hypothetical protein [Thermoplasmata archaeon]
MGPESLLASVILSSMAGTGAGFCTGLVPGLHVNNLAAIVVASSSSAVAFFTLLVGNDESALPGLMVSCFLVSALVAHMFSEAIVSTYLGIPSGDTVSLLPAHRLAKSGLGACAVRVSAQGSLFGVVAGIVLLPPICFLLGSPVDAYSSLKSVMGVLVVLLSAVLLLSEGVNRQRPVRRVVLATVFFTLSGTIGLIVLDSNYFACQLPDFPWMARDFVGRSSLLLPMFAGLFGVPTVLLSIQSEPRIRSSSRARGDAGDDLSVKASARDLGFMSLGGLLVGWIPGMTSGSSATLCSLGTKRALPEGGTNSEAARFIWLYSAVASMGAVLSVGALFAIARARSGIMQAVEFFYGSSVDGMLDLHSSEPLVALLLAMLLSAVVSHAVMVALSGRTLESVQHILCSRTTAFASLGFVVSLVLVLTGTRGGLILVTSVSLGLLPPTLGLRRIDLMGCILVPIAATFLLG